MNTKKKRRKNRFMPMACALGIFVGSLCNSYINAYAEALPNFPPGVDMVSAADCIMSYITSAGTFIANRDWIDELYTSFGGGAGFYINDLYQNGLLTLDEAGHYVSSGLETALENQSAWTSLGLDQLFSVSAQEAAVGGGVAATGAGTIAGAIGGVATTGALPLAIGVTGSYWGGIGVGTLINHLVGKYAPQIYGGSPITENFNLVNGMTFAVVGNQTFTCQYGVYTNVIKTNDGPYYYVYLINPTDVSAYVRWKDAGGTLRDIGINNHSYNNVGFIGSTLPSCSGNIIYTTVNDRFSGISTHLTQAVNDGIKHNTYSPDMICSDGNARGNYSEQDGYSVPNMTPEVNPTGQSIVPGGASRDDWLRWANGVKGNNQNDDPDANADILQEILEAIRNNNPSPGGNPNPNPNPNPTPTPTPVPKPDYDPDNPDQPEYDPKETEGPQDVTNGDPWTTPDLLDRFPFCLPRDVYRCFQKLNVNERMAPSISWHFVTPLGIHFDFDLDLEDYEGVAAILRALELIAFVIGLAIATRNLIGR